MKLQEVVVPIMNLKKCAKNFRERAIPKVTTDTICAGKGGKDSCHVSFKEYFTHAIK